MNVIKDLFADPKSAILYCIILLFAIKELITVWKWYKEQGREIFKKEADEQKTKERIADLEAKSEEQTAILEDIQKTVLQINDVLSKQEEDRKADTVAQGRAILYDLYNQLKDRESLTIGEHELVSGVFSCYEKSGGNGTFKKLSKILLEKPIEEE